MQEVLRHSTDKAGTTAGCDPQDHPPHRVYLLAQQGGARSADQHMLGHKDVADTLERTSEVYAQADPRAMRSAIRALTKFWKEVKRAADRWRADRFADHHRRQKQDRSKSER